MALMFPFDDVIMPDVIMEDSHYIRTAVTEQLTKLITTNRIVLKWLQLFLQKWDSYIPC